MRASKTAMELKQNFLMELGFVRVIKEKYFDKHVTVLKYGGSLGLTQTLSPTF